MQTRAAGLVLSGLTSFALVWGANSTSYAATFPDQTTSIDAVAAATHGGPWVNDLLQRANEGAGPAGHSWFQGATVPDPRSVPATKDEVGPEAAAAPEAQAAAAPEAELGAEEWVEESDPAFWEDGSEDSEDEEDALRSHGVKPKHCPPKTHQPPKHGGHGHKPPTHGDHPGHKPPTHDDHGDKPPTHGDHGEHGDKPPTHQPPKEQPPTHQPPQHQPPKHDEHGSKPGKDHDQAQQQEQEQEQLQAQGQFQNVVLTVVQQNNQNVQNSNHVLASNDAYHAKPAKSSYPAKSSSHSKGSYGSSHAEKGKLAHTGTSQIPLVLGASGLLVAGGALLRFRHTRRS
ncbi:hypothetical protein OG871_12055 [Kitasatospora sp. NBC_00374]|uniref:hypothetical protein n=1 Tax=Kitasatospora sp. NBC_00374 TaxID=2975964 RepID=UPI0030E0D826